MIRSAFARVCASDGAGSKVCEFVASGMIPRRRIRSPPMFRAIELIGATVVATSSLSGPPVRVSCHPSDDPPAPLTGAPEPVAALQPPIAPTTATISAASNARRTASERGATGMQGYLVFERCCQAQVIATCCNKRR